MLFRSLSEIAWPIKTILLWNGLCTVSSQSRIRGFYQSEKIAAVTKVKMLFKNSEMLNQLEKNLGKMVPGWSSTNIVCQPTNQDSCHKRT